MELRIQRFSHTHDVSVMSEKALGFLRLKHLLYIGFGVLILWRAMTLRDPGAFAFSLMVFAFGIASAIFSRGSCSFEARVVLTLISIIDSLLTPREMSRTRPTPAKPKAKTKTHRKPVAMRSATNTSTSIYSVFNNIGKALKSKTVNAAVAFTGLAMFALSTLTLFGYRTPLIALGVYGLATLAGISAAIGFAGLFMLLSSVLGNPFRGVRR